MRLVFGRQPTGFVMIFTLKDIQIVFNCSRKTAIKRRKEIQVKYKIKYVTGFHVASFLNITIDQLHYYYLTKMTDQNSDINEVSKRLLEAQKGVKMSNVGYSVLRKVK